MKRVLLIDDSVENQNEVKESLNKYFDLASVSSLAEARKELANGSYDLILSEVALPDGEGFGWCAELKSQEATCDVPVIFLTGKASTADKVRGFSVGAADYLIKPFDPLELEVRIRARLKSASLTLDREQVLQKGDLTLSVPYQKALLREGNLEVDLRLTPTEFRLLYFFIKNEGVVLSRHQLLSTIWSDDVHVLTRTIDKHISTLKKKLASRSNYIQSVHSRGYCFTLVRPSMSPTLPDSFVSPRE
jgi:DNA-binding response OmpR family regulator